MRSDHKQSWSSIVKHQSKYVRECVDLRRNSLNIRGINLLKLKGKGKAIPLQAWTGPEGFRSLRLPDFKTIGT
jgi:hypothetical protein